MAKQLSFEEDVSRVMESIKNGMGKEYRRKSTITVGEAVHEIYKDLDVSLAMCSDKAHISQRLKVMGEATERLGVYNKDNETQKVSEFLPPEYLIYESLRK